MKKDIRMIGLDLDGTSLLGTSEMAPRVRRAIEKALAAGIVVLPATGRQFTNVPGTMRDIPGMRYALTSNGAKIYDLSTGKEIYENCFTDAKALEILEFLYQFELLMGVYIDGVGYTDFLSPEFEQILSKENIEYLNSTRVFVPDLAEAIRSNGAVEKFAVLFIQEEERKRAFEMSRKREDITTTSSFHANLEINAKTANKGEGLVQLGRILGIEREQIMAIGDESNDIVMLQTVGYGVAMGNAPEEVKQIADAVTLSCQEDGVAAAIEAILA